MNLHILDERRRICALAIALAQIGVDICSSGFICKAIVCSACFQHGRHLVQFLLLGLRHLERLFLGLMDQYLRLHHGLLHIFQQILLPGPALVVHLCIQCHAGVQCRSASQGIIVLRPEIVGQILVGECSTLTAQNHLCHLRVFHLIPNAEYTGNNGCNQKHCHRQDLPGGNMPLP